MGEKFSESEIKEIEDRWFRDKREVTVDAKGRVFFTIFELFGFKVMKRQ